MITHGGGIIICGNFKEVAHFEIYTKCTIKDLQIFFINQKIVKKYFNKSKNC